jgi:soluble cytochrome b562
MSNPNNADKIASELNYSDNSPTLNKLSTPNLPETKDFDEEFDMYIKFIDDEKERQEFTEKKDDLKKYKEIYDKTPEEAIKIQEGTLNEIYDRYESAIKSIKEELPTQTKEFAKQRLFFSSRIQFQKMLRGSIFSFNS